MMRIMWYQSPFVLVHYLKYNYPELFTTIQCIMIFFASATTCTCIKMISINLIRALHKDDLLHYKEWWKITLFWMKEYLWIRYGLCKEKKLIPLLIRKEIKLKVNKWTLIFDYRLGISFVVWKTGSCIHAFVSTDKNL